MTGLAIRRRRPSRGVALVACSIAIAATAAGCGGSDSTSANLSELPPTDTLSTEQPTPSTTTTTTTGATATSSTSGGGPTILQTIRAATDADNSQYHSGATSSDGNTQTTMQYHFSTPSLDAACSSTDADTPTLICVGGNSSAGTQSPAGGTACPTGAGRIVVLTTSGAQQGNCTDAAEVLTRSQILPYGNSLSFGDFICAAEVSGLFCLDTTANSGFEMSGGTYQSVQGSQPMPDAAVPTTGGN